MARLACLYCSTLDTHGVTIPEWAQAWWKEHQAVDAQRAEYSKQYQQQSETAKRALDKLTKEERRALGLPEY